MITVNALANTLPINGKNTGDVSDSYPNLFAPTGITFVIWGVIYFMLACYIGYQLFSKNQSEEKVKLLNKIGIYFSISSLANLLWIFAWHYEIFWLSVLLILTMLYCLIIINTLIIKQKLSNKEKLFIKIPFSIYFGWITIATIANITAFITSLGVSGFGQTQLFMAAIIIIIGFLISSTVILKNRDFTYGLVIIWAYIGIFIKHISEGGFNKEYPLIIYTVISCIALLAIEEICVLFPKKEIKV